jgi:hypothetical protein
LQGENGSASTVPAHVHRPHRRVALESAAAIARSQVELHSRELAGWSYIARVLKELPPDVEEEAALWNMLGRSRRERY